MKTKKHELIIIFVITLLSININDVKAQVIEDLNSDGIIIEIADQYINGIEDIDIYTNITAQNYSLWLNTTKLTNETNPLQFRNGTWNTNYIAPGQGESIIGNIQSLYSNDTDYLNITSETKTPDNEKLNLDIFFCTGGIPFNRSFVNLTRIAMSITTRAESDISNKHKLLFWNVTSSAFEQITEIAVNDTTIINTTFPIFDNLRTFDNNFQLRLNFDSTPANDEYSINISYIHIYYESNKTISNGDYQLLDTYSLNSSQYSDGYYNLSVNIIDELNNSHVDYRMITIDNTDPDIDDIVALPVDKNNIDPISILSNITDDNLEIGYGEYENQAGNLIFINNSINEEFNHTDIFTNGTYIYYVKAIDLAGNIASKNLTFNVSYVESEVYTPSYSVFYEFNPKTGRLYIDLWSNNTSELLVYIDGELEHELDGNKSYYLLNNFNEIGIYHVQIEIYDSDGDLYDISNEYFRITATGNGNGEEEPEPEPEPEPIIPLAITDVNFWVVLLIVLIGISIAIAYIFSIQSTRTRRRKKKRRKKRRK